MLNAHRAGATMAEPIQFDMEFADSRWHAPWLGEA